MIGYVSGIITICTALLAVCKLLQEKYGSVFKRRQIWKGNQGIVEAFYGDLLKIAFSSRLKKKNLKIVVIPVDTKFTMEFIEPGTPGFVVHPNSIHGKWLIRMRSIYGKKTFEELFDLRLKKCLTDDDVQKNENGTSLNRYKIGSILPWLDEIDSTQFLLVAVGDYDDANQPLTTSDDIKKCLESILGFYRQRKTEDVYLPLIGAGMTRVKSPQEACDLFVSFFEQDENSKDIFSRFVIVVYHKLKHKVAFFKK